MKRAPSLLALVALVGCQSTYYAAWEKMGWHKRDILVDRVEDARDAQDEAKEQFVSALDQFKAVTSFDGGNLEAQYKKLSSAYDSAKTRADEVTARIKSVDDVATALFKEWEAEIDQYQSAQLKTASQQQLRATKDRYGKLLSAMRAAESKMQPVLAAFHDQVLFLKHNLNAAAIASLQDTAVSIERDVATLIRDMETSINEANAFIDQMQKEQPATG